VPQIAQKNRAIEDLSASLQDGDSRMSITGPDVMLEPSTAQTIAVILHELATNSAKYGSLSVCNGRVHVNWSHADDGQLALRWTETGGPSAKPPTRRGFGTRVMDNMLRGQMKGDMRLDWRVEGLSAEIVIPMPH
jgi:two-component sensor histidine kinase